jgi:carboxymethylenebutenolidase
MNHFQRYLTDEFLEDFEEGRLSRRQALKLIASVTGSLALANTLLAACAPPPEAPAATLAPTDAPAAVPVTVAPAPTVAPTEPPPAAAPPTEGPVPTEAQAGPPVSGTVLPDDPAIQAGPLEFPGEGAALLGYLARPAAEGAFPVVLVCHENRGLTDHIADVSRRFAKAGYAALAVDLLSRQGGSQAVGFDNVPGALGGLSPEQFAQDFLSGYQYLQAQSFARAEQVGMTGFCFGGGVTWLLATRMPELRAAVPFYGPPPPVADVPKIQAAVLAIYGENDTRINSTIPAMEAAMAEHGKTFETVVYPGADHAFHNDTSSRYNPEAAQDAWARTLDWFDRYVTV